MSPKDIEEQFTESLNNAFQDGVLYALKQVVRAVAASREAAGTSAYRAVTAQAQRVRRSMPTYERRPMCFNCAGYLRAKEVERAELVCTECCQRLSTAENSSKELPETHEKIWYKQRWKSLKKS